MKIEKYYKREARELIDFLFDKGFIAHDCSRESMRVLENYIAYILQSKINSAIRAHDLLKKIRGTENT